VTGTKHFGFIGFEDFRNRARDASLSPAEKIGFPDAVRAGRDDDILKDVLGKLSGLSNPGKLVLDIGCGCSDLPKLLLEFCRENKHRAVLVDSQEMLDLVPNHPSGVKIAGAFPQNVDAIRAQADKYDAILIYSVAQVVFAEANLFAFLDAAVALLDHGGQMLVGDMPNASMRRRFLASPAGCKHHRENYDANSDPVVDFNTLLSGELDDGIVLGCLARYRNAGYNAYVMPQSANLGMANRREDLLICRP
jgi:hypothetical protein